MNLDDYVSVAVERERFGQEAPVWGEQLRLVLEGRDQTQSVGPSAAAIRATSTA